MTDILSSSAIVINIHVYTSSYTYARVSPGNIPKSSRACTFSTLLGNEKLFSKMVVPIYAPPKVEGVLYIIVNTFFFK